MKQPDGGFTPSYNVQICTEASHKNIVAVETTQAGTDYDELVHGIHAVHANTEKTPEQMVVDGGYIKNANVEDAAERGVDLIGPVAESNPAASLKKRGVSPEFYPDKFRYDGQTDTFTCPAEKTPTFQRSSRHEFGVLSVSQKVDTYQRILRFTLNSKLRSMAGVTRTSFSLRRP